MRHIRRASPRSGPRQTRSRSRHDVAVALPRLCPDVDPRAVIPSGSCPAVRPLSRDNRPHNRETRCPVAGLPLPTSGVRSPRTAARAKREVSANQAWKNSGAVHTSPSMDSGPNVRKHPSEVLIDIGAQLRLAATREVPVVPKRIGVLLFRNVQALDVVGPTDAFAAAVSVDDSGSRVRSYEVFTVAASNKLVVSESGLALKPLHTFDSCPEMDTLLISGGCGVRDPCVSRKLAPWIARQAARTRRVAAICTGTFGLAATGLLHNR